MATGTFTPPTELLRSHGLWSETAIEAPAVPALDRDIDCDVAIIGGGFSGLSTALHLAEAGVEAVVLEAECPGWGASGRNGGQVIALMKIDLAEAIARFGQERGKALQRLGPAGVDLVFSLIERFQIRCEARRDGWIQAAYAQQTLTEIEQNARGLRDLGQEVEVIGRQEMQALTGTPLYLGGMVYRRCGMIQPLSYVRGLAAAALQTGARIYRGARVAKLAPESGRWLLTTQAYRVTAKHCVIATNGYTGDLHPALRTAIISIQSYQLATRPLPSELSKVILPSFLPVSDLVHLGAYFRRDEAGRFLIGGRGSFTDRERPDLFKQAEANAYVLYPALREVGFDVRWGGKLALTRDHLPRLVTLEPNLYAAYGFNGRGVAMATMLGKLAAERIRGAAHQDLPIATLPPARFPLHWLRLPVMTIVAKHRQLRKRFVRG